VKCHPMVLAICFMPGVASAHEVLHAVERGKAIAVKAYFADGEVLAYTEYQVFSPTDPKIPYQKGRTDRGGYLAFLPDTPGKWRVQISDATGHGLNLEIDASKATQTKSDPVASWVFVVRPVLGMACVGAIFAALVVFYRRKRSGK